MKRKRRPTPRRLRPLNPTGRYRVSLPLMTMPQLRDLLEFKRAHKREPLDKMGAAYEIAFSGLAKKPVLTRRQAWEARCARRGERTDGIAKTARVA